MLRSRDVGPRRAHANFNTPLLCYRGARPSLTTNTHHLAPSPARRHPLFSLRYVPLYVSFCFNLEPRSSLSRCLAPPISPSPFYFPLITERVIRAQEYTTARRRSSNARARRLPSLSDALAGRPGPTATCRPRRNRVCVRLPITDRHHIPPSRSGFRGRAREATPYRGHVECLPFSAYYCTCTHTYTRLCLLRASGYVRTIV